MKGLESICFDENKIEKAELENIENVTLELMEDLSDAISDMQTSDPFFSKASLIVRNAKLIIATNILALKLGSTESNEATSYYREEITGAMDILE